LVIFLTWIREDPARPSHPKADCPIGSVPSIKAGNDRAATPLHDYKAGLRSGTGVAKMPGIVYLLKDDDLKALAHYLSRPP
jgi:hypothetical protein